MQQHNSSQRTYNTKLEQGEAYQDFIAKELYQLGIIIVGFSSRKEQWSTGENMLGMEIKLDLRWPETGNLCLETAEKTNANNRDYVPSGIYRNDNSWLYLIGNYDKAWILQKNFLPRLADANRYRTYEIPTSRGILMPVPDADMYAARVLDFSRKVTPLRTLTDEVPF